MRRTGRALFVIFYFVATIGVASERCADMADRVGHATSSEFDDVKSPFSSFVKYLPYFSHAKKGQTAVAVLPAEFSWSPQDLVWKVDASPIIGFVSSPVTQRPRPRAPPAEI